MLLTNYDSFKNIPRQNSTGLRLNFDIYVNIIRTPYLTSSTLDSLHFRTLNSDKSFPDLFLSGFPAILDIAYLDYLEKKIRRLGYDPDEFAAVNPNIRALPTLLEERVPDSSNQIIHKGRTWRIPELEEGEKFALLGDLGYDQLQKYNNLECVRSQNYISTPTRKLHYPEPFIASASFVHTDIGFIHILHYQY